VDPKEQMGRRQFLGLSAGGVATLSLSNWVPRAEAAVTETCTGGKPNVLVVQPDQHRGTIMGCAGDMQVDTPNLDALAAEGIRFERCASSSPVCSPCRGSYQTGLYPYIHGVLKNNVLLDPTDTKYLAELFGEAGYSTGYIGKWHLDGGIPSDQPGGYVAPGVRRRGYQEWFGYEKSHEYLDVWKYDESRNPPVKVPVEGYSWEPAWHTDMFLDFARRNRDQGKPWMYYIAYGPPHKPEQCPDEFKTMYPPEGFTLPPDVEGKFSAEVEAELRQSLQVYYGQVTSIDVEIGRIVQGLKDLGLDDNTIIVYTSDHGDKLGSHCSPDKLRGKSAPYATAFRIPLIVRWPGAIPSGQVCDALVSSVDVAPTILELAGRPVPWKMQGDSMAAWCRGGVGPSNDGVFIALGTWQAVWDGRYVYCPSSNYRILYDHQTDPYEMTNLFGNSSLQSERDRLDVLLAQLAQRASNLPPEPTPEPEEAPVASCAGCGVLTTAAAAAGSMMLGKKS